jgi:hypothetical protein
MKSLLEIDPQCWNGIPCSVVAHSCVRVTACAHSFQVGEYVHLWQRVVVVMLWD